MESRVRTIRERLLKQVGSEYTQEAVAHRIGVSLSALQRWEVGANEPAVTDAMALAADLGVSVEQLDFKRL